MFLPGDRVSTDPMYVGGIGVIVNRTAATGAIYYNVRFGDFIITLDERTLRRRSFFDYLVEKWTNLRNNINGFFRPVPYINLTHYRPVPIEKNWKGLLWIIWHCYVFSMPHRIGRIRKKLNVKKAGI